MDEKDALQKAILHYKSVVKDYEAKGKLDECYAVPILNGLMNYRYRLEKAESQVERFDAFVKMIKG